MKTEKEKWNDYFYKGTTVLKNKEGIKNQKKLNIFEKQATLYRTEELKEDPIKGDFDSKHFKAIHQHLFQDVYEWAGKYRKVNMQKNGSNFALTDDYEKNLTIDIKLNHALTQLKEKNYLKHLNQKDFLAEFSNVYSQINHAHPFREGNGRTQQIFMQEVAKNAGYTVDYTKTSKDEWNKIFSQDGKENKNNHHYLSSKSLKNEALESLFSKIIRPLEKDEKINLTLSEVEKIKTHQEKILYGSLDDLFKDEDEQLNRVALILMMAKQGTSDKSLEYSKEVDNALRKQLNEIHKKGEEIPLPNLNKNDSERER